ncbi:MAG: hypothetical protein ABUK13_10575, partial [Gammaproteobacteria bacterium]
MSKREQGIGEGAVLDISKNLVIGRNQLSLFLQGLVKSSLSLFLMTLNKVIGGIRLTPYLRYPSN